MLSFLRSHYQLILVILVWLTVGYFYQAAVLLLLPLSVLFFKSRELWPEILFGMLIIFVFSDMEHDMFLRMIVFKKAKNFYVITVALIFMLETYRYQPLSGVFKVFMPFFIFSLFPLLFSNSLLVGLQKTLSYALLFLIVPNWVLYSFRRQGWPFFRNLIFFMTSILLAGLVLAQFGLELASVLGRFRGIFGNPNGLGIFCYLMLMLVMVLTSINPKLLSWFERLVIVALIGYFIIKTGSRTALSAALMFFIFHRFFSYSPWIGFIGLVATLVGVEVISTNFEAIVIALGLEDYFRLGTLKEGSGRYFAWEFAWIHIQDYFVFGGGFANDEFIMRSNRLYLEKMGHQGGVHNTYLSFWLNVGLVGLLLYFRSFVLIFVKASKLVPMSLAVLFSCLFSIMYESWLVGSLNPYTIVLVIIMTVVTEHEIVQWRELSPPDGEELESASPLPTAVTA
ncbi:MAG: O-antigen ligase family protein [Flavobacteriales bacterium]|nr:O-antigen ligase family protein [Flavobacteriales bacterium]